MKKIILLITVLAVACQPPFDSAKLEQELEQNKNIVDVSNTANVKLQFRYNSTDNFMKKNVYQGYKRCFLHRVAAAKFRKAAAAAASQGYKLLIFDCLRPRRVQKLLFDFVKGTAQQKYVADPAKGSIHNFGFAVDLSLLNKDGSEIDMGTAYDSFEPLAEPQLEKKFLAEGKLNAAQIENRRLLRDIMQGAGFIQLPHEWWHYDALPKAEVKTNYQIVE